MPSHLNSLPLSSSILSSLSLVLCVNCLLFLCCLSIDEQGQALLSWKQTLNSSTDALKSWNPSDPNPCKWFGITCNSNAEVTKISLSSVNLRGPLPTNFQPLKSLNTLIVSSTNITGPIPKEFGDYSEMVFIDLSKNQISGEIPSEICNLKKLDSLYLNSNSLQGSIPSNIGNLSSVTYLNLYDNNLSGVIPTSVGELQNLQVFRAGGNSNLKGPLPRQIGNCSSLVMLGLAETGISSSLPSSIGLLKRIETIAIYGALLSGPIPEEIGNCTELRSLYLYQNSLSGPIPTQLGQLRKLRELLLWQNSLVGSIPVELGNCRNLMMLDLSMNLFSGSIPTSIGKLSSLQGLQLSSNQLSGMLPSEISNCTALTDLEVDNNQLSGQIEINFQKMENLTLFYAWQNKLTGNIPENLAECQNLQALDLSYNNLSGPIPKQLFGLQNLTKLLLLSNGLSGFIPLDVGNCTNLFRFRANDNQLGGTIPSEIGNLKNLNFLDMGNNRLVGAIPQAISGCDNLGFLDLHSNSLSGPLPEKFPGILQFIDISDNRLTGSFAPGIGLLTELTKLVIGNNKLSGVIPPELSSCSKLQLLELGDNGFSGEIPPELGQLPALEISLNLSCNQLSGEIPPQFSNLGKLGILDISHNNLTGNLDALSGLQNLVTLNISFNAFSGELPATPFFENLPLSDLAGNHGLYISGGTTTTHADPNTRATMSAMKLTMSILFSISAVLVLVALYLIVRTRAGGDRRRAYDDVWEMTLYQKLNFALDEVARSLTSANVIGTGSSGVVYKVEVPGGETLAVKKMWSPDGSGGFRNEISVLESVRHRNIVRLLGWGSNRSTNLLFYRFQPNGTLSGYLHGGAKGATEWEIRFKIALSLAHAISYLHHDCVPPILHGDVKAMNVLLGARMEPYLADFGLARPVGGGDSGDGGGCKKLEPRASPRLAGSYGYMAPEHATMQLVTEKSDVYSYGVVLLEVLTGRHPLDPSLPGGAHLVQWVLDHLQRKNDPFELLDPRLRGWPDNQIQEMLQVLAIAVLCLSARASDRPAMKDIVALLGEIRRPVTDVVKESTGVDVSSAPIQTMGLKGSSSCSFALSDTSS